MKGTKNEKILYKV